MNKYIEELVTEMLFDFNDLRLGHTYKDVGYESRAEFFKEMIKKQMNTLDKIFRCNQEDDNILELKNTIGFKNLLREYNDNDEVIKEYTAKLNTLCYKNNQIIKDTKDTICIK
jgi:hypothetical protein